MAAVGVLASLAALLAANGTSVLDCVCQHVARLDVSHRTAGEKWIWNAHCNPHVDLWLYGPCKSFKPLSTARAALRHLAKPTWWGDRGAPMAKEGDPRASSDWECGGALAGVRSLTEDQLWQLYKDLQCHIAADCVHSCSVPGLNDTQWNVTTLAEDRLRRPILSKLQGAVWRVTVATDATRQCMRRRPYHNELPYWNNTELLERYSSLWRDATQLLSHGASHLSQLLLPLAFEVMGNHTNTPQLHGWIKNMQRLTDMLHGKLSGWVHDLQYASEHILNYKTEENETSPGTYILRRPLLSENLLKYQERFLSFRDDYAEVCRKRQPNASQMFSLADTLYSIWHENWFKKLWTFLKGDDGGIDIIDEEWQLEDKSSDTLSMDTSCLQLLANALDYPTCPLEDLPADTVGQREQCRQQLWEDMVQRWPRIPITSYLAYTQRTTVHLCLLAWMAVNSFGVCQDVPFSMIQSVHDARCYFDRPGDKSCPQSNATDAICVVFRGILLLKCRDFSFSKPVKLCATDFTGLFPDTRKGKLEGQPTKTTLNYQRSLNSATLKYKDFKIDSLKPLEFLFITVNILFRFLTAGVYICLPHCRNLPGKIFLSFQMTAIIQILCSEIVYRNAGVPDLSTMVLIDSTLTLLSCLWLNLFCYQMYACIRHLRLPDDLLPAEASRIFRRQVLYALGPCTIVCTICTTLEQTNNYYLIFSRIIFIVSISLSIAFNVVCLWMVGYIHLRNKKSMEELKIYSNDKSSSKKEVVFMSVKTVILSGIGIIVRIGFHQADGIAQLVYYVHIATMVQGPVLFVFFICNGTILPALKNKILAWWDPSVIRPGEELCSAAEKNLARRRNAQCPAAETSL